MKNRACLDCHCYHYQSPMYMIHDELWAKAKLQRNDLCCISCLSKRLGRKLTLQDFTKAPINLWVYKVFEAFL